MTENKKIRNILVGLGKPTLRGIRKCPKCGTFNGTRGISCKNKNCGVIFKESAEKKRNIVVSAEAVKVLTNSNNQIYSVKIKDKGVDHRGFVQLNSANNTNDVITDEVEPHASTFCYVESCMKPLLIASDSLAYLGDQTQCQHITAALNSFTEAVPLTLKNSVLNTLPLPSKTKQSIWTLATQSLGPLVQRISKQNLVVKCKLSSRNPLGLLHIFFFDTTKNRVKPELRFQCGCKSKKQYQKLSTKDEESKLHCVHFYACLCAFASDNALSQEFSQYIFLKPTEIDPTPQVDQPLSFLNPTNSSGEPCPSFAVNITEENVLRELENEDVTGVEIMEEVELDLTDNGLLGDPTDIDSSTGPTQFILQDIRFSCVRKNKLDIENNQECFTVQVNGDDSSMSPFFSMSDCSSLLTSNLSSTDPLPITPPSPPVVAAETKSILKKIIPKCTTTKKINRMNGPFCDESSVSQSFLEWLASVTERVNQTMHYQFSGKPDALKFQVPNNFFECLQQRISIGTSKKRLPNSTVGFLQKDSLPIGTFTKYIWKITNVLHLKHIFDTPLISLEVTRRFIKNRENGFEVYYGGKDSDDLVNFSKLGKSPLIKPVEYKTYLKVGIMSGVQKEPVPFIIEWVPHVLPICQIGEMVITFEFGHLKNGQLMEWTKVGKDCNISTLVSVIPSEVPKVLTSNRKRKIQPNILSKCKKLILNFAVILNSLTSSRYEHEMAVQSLKNR